MSDGELSIILSSLTLLLWQTDTHSAPNRQYCGIFLRKKWPSHTSILRHIVPTVYIKPQLLDATYRRRWISSRKRKRRGVIFLIHSFSNIRWMPRVTFWPKYGWSSSPPDPFGRRRGLFHVVYPPLGIKSLRYCTRARVTKEERVLKHYSNYVKKKRTCGISRKGREFGGIFFCLVVYN